MILGSGCLGDKALVGESVLAALESTGLEHALLVADSATSSGLGGVPCRAVRVGMGHLERGLGCARSAHSPVLIVDPGESDGLETTCRTLFGVSRAHPGLELAVSTPVEGTLASPERLGLVLEDLAGRVGFWHRPSSAHGTDHADSSWLDALGRWLVGVSLDDVRGGDRGLPPGLGEIDFARLAELVGRAVPVALDTGPVEDPALLRFTVAALGDCGWR